MSRKRHIIEGEPARHLLSSVVIISQQWSQRSQGRAQGARHAHTHVQHANRMQLGFRVPKLNENSSQSTCIRSRVLWLHVAKTSYHRGRACSISTIKYSHHQPAMVSHTQARSGTHAVQQVAHPDSGVRPQLCSGPVPQHCRACYADTALVSSSAQQASYGLWQRQQPAAVQKRCCRTSA